MRHVMTEPLPAEKRVRKRAEEMQFKMRERKRDKTLE